MTAEHLKQEFLGLPAERKRKVVSLLAHNLTIAARDAGGQGGPSTAVGKLLALNELQHTVTAKLMSLVAETPERFPDEGFLEVIFEKAGQGDCEGALLQAFQRSCAARW